MIYTRILFVAMAILVAVYYSMLVGQLFGVWKLTRRDITFARLCIPFYYWIASQQPTNNKPTKTNQKQ